MPQRHPTQMWILLYVSYQYTDMEERQPKVDEPVWFNIVTPAQIGVQYVLVQIKCQTE